MSHTLAINLSLNTLASYNTVGADSIKFEFPLYSVDFSREGNTLIISSHNGSGSQALLLNYFVENEANTLPAFELQDGSIVSGVDFLTDYEIDTAAGPSESANGLNSYSDDAGELISGIDKLGALGRDVFLSDDERSREESSFHISFPSNGNGENGNNGGDEDDGSDERFVFQSTSQIASEVTITVTNPSGEEVKVLSSNKEYIESCEVKSDGSILVTLTEAGKDALAKGDKLIFEITVSVGGEERGVEVILNAPKDFTSSDADKESHIGHVAYEHHIMDETYEGGNLVAGGTKQSDVTVTTSNGHGVENSTIQGTGKTTVNITASDTEPETKNSGIYAGMNETNDLSNLGPVTVKGDWYGIFSDGGGKTTIKEVTGDVTLEGKWGGIYTEGSGAETTITGVSGTVKATSTNNTGIYTQGGTTTIDGTGVTTNVELTGGKTTGLDTKGGTAKIFNVNNVTIKGNETGITSTADDSSERIATTTIQTVAGNVTIQGGTTGISTDKGSTTTIQTVTGKVTISGETDAISSSGANSAVNITANKIELSGHVSAEDGSINIIGYNKDTIANPNSPITVTIKANNANGVALSATNGGQNIIQGHSTSGTSDHITIVGGISADAKSVNTVSTGSGDDIITLNGKIETSDSLDIHMGEGWNQLVLTAPNLKVFVDWYGGWLNKLAKDDHFSEDIGVKELGIALPDGMSWSDWLKAITSSKEPSDPLGEFNSLITAFENLGVYVHYTNGDGGTHIIHGDQTIPSEASYTAYSTTLSEESDTSSPTASSDESHVASSATITSVDENSVASTLMQVEEILGSSDTVASSDETSVVSAALSLDTETDSYSGTLVDFTSTQDIHLDDADDTVHLIGGHYSHVLDMGDGDDTLAIIDTDLTDATILMGEGNDHLSLVGDVTLDHTTIEGGTGYDVLEIGDLSALHSSDGTFGLSSLIHSVSGFEVIDLSGASGTLHVDLDSLLELGIDSADAIQYTLSTSAQDQDFDVNSLSADNTLVIKADSSESVRFDPNWHDSGAAVSDGGHEYTVYTTSYEEEEYFILLQTGL